MLTMRFASASHQRKPADCQGCRRARLCPVRGTHTKSASFKDSVAGLTGRYRTSLLVWLASFCLVEIGLKVSPLPRLDLPLCSDELILPRYHFYTDGHLSAAHGVVAEGFTWTPWTSASSSRLRRAF